VTSGAAGRYTLVLSSTARRQLAESLPEAIAFAAHDFIVGPLLENPQRVGKPLSGPLGDRYSARRGTYRIIYRVDVQTRVVTLIQVAHRRDVYRSR